MGWKAIVAEAGPACFGCQQSTRKLLPCPSVLCTSVLDALRGPEERAALPREEERLRQGMEDSSGVRPEGVTPTQSHPRCWTASGSTFPWGKAVRASSHPFLSLLSHPQPLPPSLLPRACPVPWGLMVWDKLGTHPYPVPSECHRGIVPL